MRQYLYHESKAPMIVNVNDEHEGWKDSPMYFIKTTDFGVDPKDTVKVQCLGESIEGVKDCCNGLLNLDLMSIKELREFTSSHYKKVKARSKIAIIKKIEALNGNCSGHH
jgi:hypothetical protein